MDKDEDNDEARERKGRLWRWRWPWRKQRREGCGDQQVEAYGSTTSYLTLDIHLLERSFPSNLENGSNLAGKQADTIFLLFEESFPAIITQEADSFLV